MAHKKPDRQSRRVLRRASRPPTTMTRRSATWFYIGLVAVALVLAVVIVFAVQ